MHVDGLPANESLRHFVLKWAAYRVLTQELECPFALVEADARVGATRKSRLPRHDALGVRFRTGRAQPPWEEVDANRVRLQLLDPETGLWRAVAPGPEAFADKTLRGIERLGDGCEQPLRQVRAAARPGYVRVRRSGSERRELAQLCGADAKQSRGDLLAWLHEAERRLKGVALFVIVAPLGLTRPEELPPKVGLAEVDLDRLLDAAGEPAIRMTRLPELLRPGTAWAPERTAEFQRHAYYALHGLFGRQLFWFLAQTALERRVAAEIRPVVARPTDAAAVRPPASRLKRNGGGALRRNAPPEIRAYRRSDRDTVVDLWQQAGLDRPWLDLAGELDRHPDPNLVLIATVPAAGLVGAVMGCWDGRRGWIYHLAVAQAYRRCGMGRALLTAVEARLRERGAPKVHLMIRDDNAEVLAFYERCGYQPEAVSVRSKWLR